MMVVGLHHTFLVNMYQALNQYMQVQPKTKLVLLKKMIKHAKICIPGISDLILSAGREPKVKAGW